MDNLAHALVGAALARAVADPRVARAGLIGAVAANAPDWTEVFIGLPGPRAAYFELHRGVTHSIAGAIVEIIALTLLIGLGMRAWRHWRKPPGAAPPPPTPWGPLGAAIAAAVFSHLFMDWQGSYGLRPFLPWDNTWYYGDWVAIVDVFFWLLPLIALAWGSERHWRPLGAVLLTAGLMTYLVVRTASFISPVVVLLYSILLVIMLVGWVRHWFGPVDRRRAAALALLVLAAYSASQGVVSLSWKSEIRREAVRRFGPGATWAALTEAGWPFRWEAVYASRDTVAGDGWRVPRNLDLPVVQRAIRETPDGRAIAQFARFLVAEVDSTDGGNGVRVYLLDARYARGDRSGWATLNVRMD
jgi:membrane-bound metal-dependent hydrolase YbcI (DUF457 family)